MALNCEASSLIQLKFELHWDFMPHCPSCKQVWRRSKWKWTSFFSTTQGHITPKWLIRSGRNLNLSTIFMPVLVTCKFYWNWIQSNWEKMDTSFSPIEVYKSMGEKIQHSRANNSKVNNPIQHKFQLILSFYACPRYLQVWQISHQRWLRKVWHIIFCTTQGM